ncbi:MAG: hypothetical protein HQK93_08275 [Nitrospirae bacterium]|nr:hypothetical protein [Nitrospirota bacterium]
MTQYEAVKKTMEENGGYATLAFLNQNVLKNTDCKWGTKTPFASIRKIVQDKRFFFKIKPGLWALLSYKKKLPIEILPSKETPIKEQEIYNHSYYQGLLVEIGNLKKFDTFVPHQDKNKKFLGKPLKDISSINDFYNFGYKRIVDRAKTIDVSWFNERKMPNTLFEIEHSTDFVNSLTKFSDLQDFNISFFIVADKIRKSDYERKLSQSAFLSS